MTFRLAPMDFLMRLLTLALLALPPLFLAIALLGNRWLLGPAVFLGARYVWIWLWFRPTRFVVQPRVGAGGLWGGFGGRWTQKRRIVRMYIARSDGLAWPAHPTDRPWPSSPGPPAALPRPPALPGSR